MDAKGGVYRLRRATERDLPEIANLLSGYNFGLTHLEWLKWKYLDNPEGPALIYVAEDDKSNIVAMSVRLPRRFTSEQTGELPVRQHVDVFTASEYRRQGLFAKLLDFGLDERKYFLLGFPNKYSRIVKDFDRVVPIENWTFPLALSQWKPLQRFKVVGPLADFVSEVYARAWLGRHTSDLEMKEVTRFQTDFKIDSGLIHGIRTAAYLNWRFIDNPMFKYNSFEFRENDKPIGYCVYAISGSAAEIFDLICTKRQKECIRLLVDQCRSRNFVYLSFRGANLELKQFGFFCPKSSEDCIIAGIPKGPHAPEGPWLLTLGDRDV